MTKNRISVEQKFSSLRKRSVLYAKLHNLLEIRRKMAWIFSVVFIFIGACSSSVERSPNQKQSVPCYFSISYASYFPQTLLLRREMSKAVIYTGNAFHGEFVVLYENKT